VITVISELNCSLQLSNYP